MSEERRYVYTLSELIDRLCIVQLKEVKIPEHKDKYAQEIKDIVHDLNIALKEENVQITGELIRAIVVLSQFNNHIWVNEANWRKGIREGNNLELSHGLNSIRNQAKNMIQDFANKNTRKDYKLDNVAAFPEWVPSW